MFQKAVPIWLDGLQSEMNIQAVFTAHFSLENCQNVIFTVTGASLYRLKVNGVFAGYGPARAPHGYARVDKIDISSLVKCGDNEIEAEVAGYNCASFYTRRQLSFLCAEVTNGNACLAFTGRDFKGKWRKSRLQKVMRYSFQRNFSEVYDFGNSDLDMDVINLPLQLQFIDRGTALPDYHEINAALIKEKGNLIDAPVKELMKDRYIVNISTILTGFREDELESKPYFDLQQKKYVKDNGSPEYKLPVTIHAGEYVLFDMTRNVTGFIKAALQAKKDSHIMITFDEKLIDGIIDYKAISMINLVDYRLKKQDEYNLESFEAYGFRYIAVLVIDGEITLNHLRLRSYQYPVDYKLPSLKDESLKQIYQAALETFSQNTLDVYMDCPTRERAGWLCDSYFTSQVEYLLTGKSDVERVFMNNFILPDYQPDVPKGMLPMCYPANHYDGVFIPQWSMWYVLELEQFLKRCPDENADKYKKLCYDMVNFLEGYKNKDGLLEKLPSWNFVEWSKANQWVNDVNYPTNMLYARVLEVIGSLYQDTDLLNECRNIRQEVIKQSFTGKLFTDHSIRDRSGNLYNPGDISEVCQYYAVWTGLISIENPKYQTLKKYVLTVFGTAENPEVMGEIEPANAFIGIYLRMLVLLQMKEYRKLLDEIKDFFGGMAEHTGTLWENKTMTGSLNHGFASYVTVVINKALEGL